MKIRAFFCAECGTKFESEYTEIEMQWGEISVTAEHACPNCGGRETYTDTKAGHEKENRVFLDYDNEINA